MQAINVCMICGHEENLHPCPKCKRSACYDCAQAMEEAGHNSNICLYCGWDITKDPKEIIEFEPEKRKEYEPPQRYFSTRTPREKLIFEEEMQKIRIERPEWSQERQIAVAQKRTLDRAIILEQINQELGERRIPEEIPDLWPADIGHPDWKARNYDGIWNSLVQGLRGHVRTVGRIKNELDGRKQFMPMGAIRKRLKRMVDLGTVLKKPRAWNKQDVFYFLTEEEIKEKTKDIYPGTLLAGFAEEPGEVEPWKKVDIKKQGHKHDIYVNGEHKRTIYDDVSKDIGEFIQFHVRDAVGEPIDLDGISDITINDKHLPELTFTGAGELRVPVRDIIEMEQPMSMTFLYKDGRKAVVPIDNPPLKEVVPSRKKKPPRSMLTKVKR